MDKKIPLSVILEDARSEITAAFSSIAARTQLPAYLLEGIIAGILADVRNQKNLELARDYSKMNEKQPEEGETENGEH